MVLSLFRLANCLFDESTVGFKDSLLDSLDSVEERSLLSENIANLNLEPAFGPSLPFENESQKTHVNGKSAPRRSIITGKVVTDIENISNVLDNQLDDMNSEIKDRIASSIESKNIDRSRFRDIFVVKKRILSDGERKIVKYDIDEKLIPKYSNVVYQLSTDTQTKVILVLILILLAALVFTTTIRLYDSLIKSKLFQKCDSLDLKV